LPFPEEELIRQAQTGDRAAFDRLVEHAYPLVFNTAYRILMDYDSASDATQTAFVRAYRSLHTFQGTSTFTTWLYRIVTNVCLDMMRKQKRQAQSLTLESEDEGQPEREIPDERHHPERLAIESELQRTVHEALARLRPEHRLVLTLFDLSGFSYEEIAGILNMPLGTVKSRLNRARHALREELEPHRELLR
jgi:RNA polymerase sigma-70 factor, ECF subfamily